MGVFGTSVVKATTDLYLRQVKVNTNNNVHKMTTLATPVIYSSCFRGYDYL
jgi:hypothetical protein